MNRNKKSDTTERAALKYELFLQGIKVRFSAKKSIIAGAPKFSKRNLIESSLRRPGKAYGSRLNRKQTSMSFCGTSQKSLWLSTT
jgi:hypothetical protein